MVYIEQIKEYKEIHKFLELEKIKEIDSRYVISLFYLLEKMGYQFEYFDIKYHFGTRYQLWSPHLSALHLIYEDINTILKKDKLFKEFDSFKDDMKKFIKKVTLDKNLTKDHITDIISELVYLDKEINILIKNYNRYSLIISHIKRIEKEKDVKLNQNNKSLLQTFKQFIFSDKGKYIKDLADLFYIINDVYFHKGNYKVDWLNEHRKDLSNNLMFLDTLLNDLGINTKNIKNYEIKNE